MSFSILWFFFIYQWAGQTGNGVQHQDSFCFTGGNGRKGFKREQSRPTCYSVASWLRARCCPYLCISVFAIGSLRIDSLEVEVLNFEGFEENQFYDHEFGVIWAICETQVASWLIAVVQNLVRLYDLNEGKKIKERNFPI
ncbi:hypothetical protein F5Y02DRAFT_2957 [Annulohypoxylon stygium]|nr:hypothetical protein F5Y02DRAFT_2957 [Annulohypoxylon stygium]